MKILVTGGAGFIGSAFIRMSIGETDWRVVNLDKLTYAGNLENLAAVGTAPIAWSVTSGALPPGLSLGASTGIIGGTPTAPGIFTFKITAANAGGSNSEQLSLTVTTPPTPPSIGTASPLPAALTGSVYRSEERRVGKECRSRWSRHCLE